MTVRRARCGAWLLLAAVTSVACGDDAAIDAEDGGLDQAALCGDAADATVDPALASLGAFAVELRPAVGPADAFTSVKGTVHDRPLSSGQLWETLGTDGDCALLEPHFAFCDPDCEVGDVCVEDGVCEPDARAQSVGTVTLCGVEGAEGATLEPLAPINRYQVVGALPYPAFEEGRPVTVDAAGGEAGPFVLSTAGIAPLVVDADAEVAVVAGEPLPLRWDAGSEPSARIHVEVDISHHGGLRGAIRCETDDDGELDIGAALVMGLVDLGVSGFPVVDMSRRTMDSTPLGGHRVDLIVTAAVQVPLAIPGLTSCVDDSGCPGGQRCQDDMRCE